MQKYLFLIFLFFINSAFAVESYSKLSVIEGQYQENKVLIAIEFELDDGWHTYDDRVQDIGFSTSVKFSNMDQISSYKAIFPEAKMFKESGFVTYGYKNDFILPIEIITKSQLNNFSGKLIVNYAICKNICLPVTKELSFSLEQGQVNIDNIKKINSTDIKEYSILLLIILSIITGAIFNFMPCVLPVLMLKIVGFLEKREKEKKQVVVTSFYTVLGIISSFLLLALFTIFIKFSGGLFGWGAHFQNSYFILFLIMAISLFLLNNLGFFHFYISGKFLKKLSSLEKRESLKVKGFASGVLVALLSTPCSAPLLASAISIALASNILNIFICFISIGIGLSFPYIILIFFPNLLKKLPKAGKWMYYLKITSSLLLFITIIWLLWVLLTQQNFYFMAITVMSLFAILILFKFKDAAIKLIGIKIFIILLLINTLIPFISLSFQEKRQSSVKIDNNYIDYLDIELNSLIEQNKTVFIDVTANWCLTCKVNEAFILNTDKIQKYFIDNEIILVKADYTNKSAEITVLLESVNRFAIPTYIIYNKKHRKGLVLRDLLTKKYLIQELENAQ